MMATIAGINTGGGLLNQGQKTTQAKTTTSIKTAAPALTVSKTFNEKPKAGDLKTGEVGTYQSKGKTVYVVGTVNGGLTAGTSNVKNATQKLDKVVKAAEAAQVTNLADENKIEITEIKKTLAKEGLSKAEIDAAVKAETNANKQELAKAKTELKQSGYQVLSRDATTGLIGAKTWTPTTTTVQNADGTTTTKTDYSLPITTSFNTSSVENADGTMGTSWNSLSYNGKGSDAVKTNIVNTLDDVNQLKLMYGLNNDIYTYSDAGKTQSTTGVSDAALYNAFANGNITYNDTKEHFTLNPGVSNISSLLRKDGGKGFERIIQGVLVRDTAIGDKAFIGTDSKGNLRIQKGENGEFMSGKLVDSGQLDGNKNKIFVHEGGWDTKYNKASYNSIYVQKIGEDGKPYYEYMGTPDVGYTHIDKQKGFNLGSFVAQAALGFVAAQFGVPALGKIIASQFGLSTGTANIAAAALLGGGVSAIKGSGLEGILTDSALAAIGQGLGDVLGEAAKQAGGWTNLADDMYRNGLEGYVTRATNTLFTSNVSPGIKVATDAAGNVVDAVTGTPFKGAGVDVGLGTTVSSLQPAIDLTTGAGLTAANNALAQTGSGLLNETIKTAPVRTGTIVDDIISAGMPDTSAAINAVDTSLTSGIAPQGINLSRNAAGEIIDNATGLPFSRPGIRLAVDAAGNLIDANTGLPFTAPGINFIDQSTGQYLPKPTNPNVTPPSTGLIDSIQNATGLSPWQQAALVGGAGLGVVGANVIKDMLNPDIPSASWNPFPQSSIAGGQKNMLGMPDWWQNLYSRGGFGAGNYLGYDILRGLNVPADVQSLLGTNSGQNTGSSLIA